MYNGIGLATVRGSATSGHISKNLSYLRPEFFRNKLDSNQSVGKSNNPRVNNGSNFQVNKSVLEHNRKHAIEAQVFEFEETLREESGLSEHDIEKKVAHFRNSLKENNNRVNGGKSSSRATDTHESSARKHEDNERLRNAFGISAKFVSGSSIDPVAQEERRKEREMERIMRNESRDVDRMRRDKEFEEKKTRGEIQSSARRDIEFKNYRDNRDNRDNQRGRSRDRVGQRQFYVVKERSDEELQRARRESSRNRSRDRRQEDFGKRKRSCSPELLSVRPGRGGSCRSSSEVSSEKEDGEVEGDVRRMPTRWGSLDKSAVSPVAATDDSVVLQNKEDILNRRNRRSPSSSSSSSRSSNSSHSSSSNSYQSSDESSQNNGRKKKSRSGSPARRNGRRESSGDTIKRRSRS